MTVRLHLGWRAAGIVLAAGIVAAGCATAQSRPSTPTIAKALVVPRVVDPQNRAIAERAADLFATAMRSAQPVVSAAELAQSAAVEGTASWTLPLLARIAEGGHPNAEEAAELVRTFMVTELFVLDVTTYDQVWGKYAKFTRVGIAVRAVDLPTGRTRYAHRDTEVEDDRGRAFENATEAAVWDIARAFGGGRFSAMDVWRYWRR